MKKAVCLALILALALAAGTALAEEGELTVYELPDLGISVPMPAEMYVFSRYLAADDGLFGLFGLDGQEVLDSMMGSATYLDAVSGDRGREFVLTIFGSEQADYQTLTDEELTAVAEGLAAEMTGIGMEIAGCETRAYDGAAWVVLRQRTPEGTSSLLCLTVKGGLQVGLAYTGYNPATVDSDEAMLARMLDDITFPGAEE